MNKSTPCHTWLALGLWTLVMFMVLCSNTVHAQIRHEDITQCLADIEAHNPQLQSMYKANLALMADKQVESRPGAASVEYSPFYQGSYQGVASSELVIQQEFDFPTLYASRHKSGKAMRQVLDLQYSQLRRDILLQAVIALYDLCEARQTQCLLHDRISAADTLLMAYKRRLEQGDATRLDVNRIRMDRMELAGEALRCESRIYSLTHELVRLNGDLPLVSTDVVQISDPEAVLHALPYASAVSPLAEAPASTDSREVQLADATRTLTHHELSQARQSWLPQLSLGYRRNTEQQEALHGFIVGVSLPLWSQSAKVKAARLRQEAAEADLSAALSTAEVRQQSLISEARQLRVLLDTYDDSLMHEQLILLRHAVEAGQLSIIDYYTEADRIHTLLLSRLKTQVEYHKLIANIYRDQL